MRSLREKAADQRASASHQMEDHMEVSQYETIAQSFLDDHPLGTVVTGSKLLNWVKAHPDGAAIKPDLAIEDNDKRLNALRRHLNHGARSDAMSEDRRFHLQIEDAKRKTYIVRSYSDVTTEQAKAALSKSLVGALSPLKRARQAVDDIKLDELSEAERDELEKTRENVATMEAAVKPVFANEVSRIWVNEMKRIGFTPDQAKKVLAALPQVTRLQKLIRLSA
jgi:hypothetical protein